MITTTPPTQTGSPQDVVVVRALSSITSDQANIIAGIVQSNRQGWDIQIVDDYDGYLSVLIEPTVGRDEQKALFVAGTAQRLELFETQDDDLTPIGRFSDIEALGAQLTGLIGPQ